MVVRLQPLISPTHELESLECSQNPGVHGTIATVTWRPPPGLSLTADERGSRTACMSLIPNEAVGPALRAAWRQLRRVPGGRAVFSRAIGWSAPYTNTIGATVVELRPGFATVTLRDRRGVRNHLRCVHAMALANLGEMTTGLAMSMGMPDNARGILTGFSMEYLKKARGDLVATCSCTPPAHNRREQYEVEGVIRDAGGQVVARARARWLVGPISNGHEIP
ncbi:MAG: hotdog fold domain-containing protein [Myxococcota bacterium]